MQSNHGPSSKKVAPPRSPKSKPGRKPIAPSNERTVLVASRRRCCLCFYVDDLKAPRKGQIAHLNHDPADSRLANLVWLCFEHHDQYDGRTRLSKNWQAPEVRHYRDALYAELPQPRAPTLAGAPARSDSKATATGTADRGRATPEIPAGMEYLRRPWRFPLWQIANEPELFAYKAENGSDGVCLIERIDLPDGRIAVACVAVAGNPGQSITNCVEELAFQVCQRFEIPPADLVWLEHYDYDKKPSWELVTFAKAPPNGPFESPNWTEITPKMWHDLGLSPKQRLIQRRGTYTSKLTKHFYWPSESMG